MSSSVATGSKALPTSLKEDDIQFNLDPFQEEILDVEGLMDLVGEEKGMAVELVGELLDQIESTFTEIKQLSEPQTFKDEEIAAIQKAAHSLKGAALNVGTNRVGAICKNIELAMKYLMRYPQADDGRRKCETFYGFITSPTLTCSTAILELTKG